MSCAKIEKHMSTNKLRNNPFCRIIRTVFLITLIYHVHSEGLYDPNIKVPILGLNDIVIERYHGPMNAKTMSLFSNVETLTFQECNFTTFNEDFIHPLKRIKKLIVVHSHYERARNDLTTCCKHLEEMEFISSHMSALEEVEFKKVAAMKSLKRLFLFRMDVPILKTNSLQGSNMKNLEIEYSSLETVEEGAFNGMDSLEVLKLEGNKLKTIPTKSLAVLKSLKHLNLAKNLLEKISTEDFPIMPNLEIVNLGHNPVKEINLKGLTEKLPKLKEVDVSGIDIDPTKNEGVPLIKIQVG